MLILYRIKILKNRDLFDRIAFVKLLLKPKLVENQIEELGHFLVSKLKIYGLMISDEHQ